MSKKAKIEKEFEEIKELAENTGISDLMKIFGEYKILVDISTEFLQEFDPKFTLSTTNNSI